MDEEQSFDEISEEAIEQEVLSSLGTNTTSTERRQGPGRRRTTATNVLILFLRKALDLPPKFEYLRAFLVRNEKKLVRCVLEGKRFKFCCPPAKEALVQLIIDNRDDLSSSNAAGTKSDPSQNPEFSSFKAAYLRKHFSNRVMSDLHDFMIASIFDHCEQQTIEQFLSVRVKDDCNPDQDLHKLRLLLLSPYFKGEPDSEETLRLQIEDLDMPARQDGEQTPVHIDHSGEYDYLDPISYP
jgi:hypothetical protein